MPSKGGLTFRTRVVFNHFPKIKSSMVSTAESLVEKTAQDLVAGMQVRAPVDTGFLKSSIQAQKVGAAHWQVTIGADYGVYVEFGTRFTQAQPYFYPAIAEVSPAFLQAMRRITS